MSAATRVAMGGALVFGTGVLIAVLESRQGVIFGQDSLF
jgi:hypothetical protein